MNPEALRSLQFAEQRTDITAQLQAESGQIFYFLYNPETIRKQRSVNYLEGITAIRSVPTQQYSHTNGKTFTFTDLLMESAEIERSLQPLIDQLESLMVANPSIGKYSPDVVYFIWGSQRTPPCVIQSMSWEESRWLSGEPAFIRLTLTLLEIPFETGQQIFNADSPEDTALDDILLTDRQQNDGSQEGRTWLNQNFRSLDARTRRRIQSGQFSISTNQSGEVSMLTQEGSPFLDLGSYDGNLFQPIQVS